MPHSPTAQAPKNKSQPGQNPGELGKRLYSALERLRMVRQPLDTDAICCHGITHNQWTLLRLLCECGEEAPSMGALASGMDLTPSGVTRCADPLVAQELVERVVSPGDRRVCCLRPTEKGRTLWREIFRDCAAREGRLLERFPAEQRETIVRGLEQLAGAAEKARETAAGI